MVQDLKLSHTVNVCEALLTSVLARWNGIKAFGNCHRYHQHGGRGARGGAVVTGTALQAGRLRVRFSMVSLVALASNQSLRLNSRNIS
jgi:hypothetical protein